MRHRFVRRSRHDLFLRELVRRVEIRAPTCRRDGTIAPPLPIGDSHDQSSPRVHSDRTAGRNRHHCRTDRVASSRRAGSPRSGKAVQCVNNLKQFGLALNNYESSRGVSPFGQGPDFTMTLPVPRYTRDGRPTASSCLTWSSRRCITRSTSAFPRKSPDPGAWRWDGNV